MLEKCAKLLTDWLVVSDVIQKEEKEMYAYAAHSLLLLLLPIFMAAIIGISIGHFLHSIVLILPFMTIRKFSGGYHARNSNLCLVCSWSILFIFIYVSSCITMNVWMGIITMCATGVLWIFSPIDSENRPLEDDEKVRYNKSTIKLTTLFVASIIICCFSNLSSYACSLSMGIVMTASLQIPCILKGHFSVSKHNQKST